MTEAKVFDDTQCSLGEGPLWHPERNEFFWFDINECRLYSRTDAGQKMWQFDEHVTAAGWIDRDHLMVASETALLHFNITTGENSVICPLEAENLVTRSNDGRADPYGGFWIGTMGKEKQTNAGAIYRFYRGEIRQIFAPWSIPNAMCFSPDGRYAYLTDTPVGKVLRQPLDAEGWPSGAPEVLIDMPAASYRPDGAVVDAEGQLWIAHYGHGKITVHTPDGKEVAAHPIRGRQTTCPAFGGEDLSTLFVTSARQTLSEPSEFDGTTFVLNPSIQGQAEYRVIL